MGQLVNDLIYAVRALLRRPLLALTITLTLAAGIGANAAIFNIVRVTLLGSLPFVKPDEIVQLQRLSVGQRPTPGLSPLQFVFWRDGGKPFSSMAACGRQPLNMSLRLGDRPEAILGRQVTREFFETVGFEPLVGRGFTAEEDTLGGSAVVMLSHRLWRQRFNGDREVVGQSLRIDGQSFEVVGVMPEEMRFPEGTDVWVPLQIDPATKDRQAYLLATARLREGVTPAAAAAAMQGVEEEYLRLHGNGASPQDEVLVVTPFREYLYGDLRVRFVLLQACVLIVLLVVCVNLANLQLAQLNLRRQELAIRIALGAPPGRLIQMLVAETAVLAVAGGLLGLLVERWTSGLLGRVVLSDVQRLFTLDLDVATVLSIVAMVFVITLAIGLFVGARSIWIPAAEALREGGRGGGGRTTLRRLLVVAEIGLTVPAVLTAILLMRGVDRVAGVETGFRTEDVLSVQIPVSQDGFGHGLAWERFCRELVTAIENRPEIESAGLTSGPLLEPLPSMTFLIPGHDGEGLNIARVRAICPGFLKTLNIPVISGRGFAANDHRDAAKVVIINQVLAERFWPGENPIGRYVQLGPPMVPELGDPVPREIIGIASDVREDGLAMAAPATFYLPFPQVSDPLARRYVGFFPMLLVARTELDSAQLVRMIEDEVRRFDPDLPVIRPRKMQQVVEASLGTSQSVARLVGLFSLLALLLAAVGLHALIASAVTARTREIGIRMVVGADRKRIFWQILGEGLREIGVGLAVGFGVGWFALRGIESWLGSFAQGAQIDQNDFVAYGLTCAVLISVGILATLAPALRSSRVEPSAAMRIE